VKKLIVRTLTIFRVNEHEPILTGQVGAVINGDLGQRRATCISGRVRHQQTSTSSVVIERKSEALRREVFYSTIDQSDSAERLACLLRRLQSRCKTFNLLKSEIDASQCVGKD